jgi:hypothetical protein
MMPMRSAKRCSNPAPQTHHNRRKPVFLRLQDKHAGNEQRATRNDQRSTSNEQRIILPIHFADNAPLSALSTMRAHVLKTWH